MAFVTNRLQKDERWQIHLLGDWPNPWCRDDSDKRTNHELQRTLDPNKKYHQRKPTIIKSNEQDILYKLSQPHGDNSIIRVCVIYDIGRGLISQQQTRVGVTGINNLTVVSSSILRTLWKGLCHKITKRLLECQRFAYQMLIWSCWRSKNIARKMFVLP